MSRKNIAMHCFNAAMYITYVPIDLDGIDKQYLNAEDVKQLNDYHKMVYEKISPYMTPEENEWLKEYTREI